MPVLKENTPRKKVAKKTTRKKKAVQAKATKKKPNKKKEAKKSALGKKPRAQGRVSKKSKAAPIKVVSDKDKFALALGVPENLTEALGIPIAGGVLIGAVGGMAYWIVLTTSMGPIAKLAVVLGIMASPSPIAPLSTMIILSMVGASGIGSYKKYKKWQTKTSKKSFHSRLDVIGVDVAQSVFLPSIAMALADDKLHPKESAVIKREMKKWGYHKNWIDSFFKQAVDELGYDGIISGLKVRQAEIKKATKKFIGRDYSLKQVNQAALKIAKKTMTADGIIHDNEKEFWNDLKSTI